MRGDILSPNRQNLLQHQCLNTCFKPPWGLLGPAEAQLLVHSGWPWCTAPSGATNASAPSSEAQEMNERTPQRLDYWPLTRIQGDGGVV